MTKYFKLLIIFAIFSTGCSLTRLGNYQTPVYKKPVRVAVLRGVKSFSLQVKGPYRISILENDALLAQEQNLYKTHIINSLCN